VSEGLFPISLGNYVVTNPSDATEVFNVAKNNNAVNMLAGQLLATKLGIAHDPGLDTSCLGTTIADSDALLVGASYSGPGTGDVIKGKDKGPFNDVKNPLNDWNNDGC